MIKGINNSKLTKFYLTQFLCTMKQDIPLDDRVWKYIIILNVLTGRWKNSKLPFQLGDYQQIMLKLLPIQCVM